MSSIVPKSLRTVKWYVRYRPGSNTVIHCEYRSKRAAEAAQCVGEVVLQVKGHYFPNMVKKPSKKGTHRR